MKRLKLLCMVAVAGLLFTGCASVAYVEKDDTVNFNTYNTFSWIETKEVKTETSKSITDLTERNMKNAVSKELEKAGWQEVKNRPDVLLSYDVLVEKTVKEDNNPVYSQPYRRFFFNPYLRRWGSIYYPSQFLGYDNGLYEVREGTVTITMIDAKTDKTVWQGWTTDEVNSRHLSSKEIQNSVKSIFRKFDVVKK